MWRRHCGEVESGGCGERRERQSEARMTTGQKALGTELPCFAVDVHAPLELSNCIRIVALICFDLLCSALFCFALLCFASRYILCLWVCTSLVFCLLRSCTLQYSHDRLSSSLLYNCILLALHLLSCDSVPRPSLVLTISPIHCGAASINSPTT